MCEDGLSVSSSLSEGSRVIRMEHTESSSPNAFYSVDAVMFESKKKKKDPNLPTDPKDMEGVVKGKKVRDSLCD